ncbi:MAG: CPBP family intramembrane glutamic endopeptidase [Sphingomonadaceae bacterium]
MQARKPGWGRFTLQFFTVVLAYVVAAAPPILIWGETGTGLLGSVVSSVSGALLVVWFWLRADGTGMRAVDLSLPQSWPRALLIASGAAIAILLWFQIGGTLVRAAGFAPVDPGEVIQYVTQSPASLVLWVVLVAWFAAGFGEEVLWRGFLLDRLMHLPGIAGRAGPAIIIQAILFGLPHMYQGGGGVIVTSVIGLFLGWLRIRTGGNLWPLIIAHAAVDTVMMGLAYAGAAGWITLSS